MTWFPLGTVAAAVPPAGGAGLVLEDSGIEESSAGTTTRTFTVNVPVSLTDPILCFAPSWFQNTSTITNVTFDGSASGVVQVGSTLAADEAGNRDGMAMYRVTNPTSGSSDIVVTFDESQGGDVDTLQWFVWSGADQTANVVDAFLTPTDRGNPSGSDYDESLTTSVDNCAVMIFTVDFQLEPAGSISTPAGYTAISPRPDYNDAFSDVVGASGNHDYTYTSSGNGSDMTIAHMAIRPS